MILITGGNGQLGSEVRNLFDEYSIEYKAPSSSELNITNYDNVDNYLTELRPDYIIHCAAYTAVDLAEDEGKALNHEVNANGTKNITQVAKKIDATVIYISTDYVFDGNTDKEYNTDSKTNPINEYGKAKLLGEEAIKDTLEKYYIIRTSWVFGQFGKNFVFTMRRLAESNSRLTIVNDQFGRPTWTKTIAEFIKHIIDTNAEYGIYHISNDGSCTWYEFACEILKDNKKVEIVPITTEQFPQKATRPKYSIMDLSKAKNIGFNIPTWQEALENMLNNKR